MRARSLSVPIAMIASAVFAVIIGCGGAARAETQAVEITISNFLFAPDTVTLKAGVPAVLKIRNEDPALHEFIANEFFNGMDVAVSGGGSAERGPDGLARILIEKNLIATVRFTPTKPGTYVFRCDLPGHGMKGEFVVQ